jgi:hypothetical protein
MQHNYKSVKWVLGGSASANKEVTIASGKIVNTPNLEALSSLKFHQYV